MGFKNKAGGKILSGPNPVCPQRGPYEASEGIYPVGQGNKLGEGKGMPTLPIPSFLFARNTGRISQLSIAF